MPESGTPEGEVLPPHNPLAPQQPPEYVPAQPDARRRRDYSAWNPRSAPATYALVAINVAVFLWMVFHGASVSTPSSAVLLQYGACDTGSILLRGEWWRLLTATFLHVGILHLGANMWCLWNLGLLGEPLIGPMGLIAIYLLTGLAGNLLSLAWDVIVYPPVTPAEIGAYIGAGASGAVFGIAGLLIILLSNRKLPIPWPELRRLRQSVIQFSVINLIIGASTMVPGLGSIVRIDNSAHLGGFLYGIGLGVPLVPRMTSGRQRYLSRQKVVFLAGLLLLALFGYWVYRLKP